MKKTIVALVIGIVLSSCHYEGQPGHYLNPDKAYGRATGNAGMTGKLNANGFIPSDTNDIKPPIKDSLTITAQEPGK